MALRLQIFSTLLVDSSEIGQRDKKESKFHD